MKLKTFISLTAITAISSIAYAVNYLVKNDEFSEDTIDKYNHLVKNMKAVGNDVKRTYTSIGDKKNFESSTKSLSKNAKKLYNNGISLVKTAGSDMYSVFKDKFNNENQENYEKSKKNKNKSKSKNKKFNKNKTKFSDKKRNA